MGCGSEDGACFSGDDGHGGSAKSGEDLFTDGEGDGDAEFGEEGDLVFAVFAEDDALFGYAHVFEGDGEPSAVEGSAESDYLSFVEGGVFGEVPGEDVHGVCDDDEFA